MVLMQQTKDTRQLTWLLAWAVVFCDIGTSVYYVPGILYGNVGDNTPFFVLLTTIGFIPLALKYIEISWRNPEGGGESGGDTIKIALQDFPEVPFNALRLSVASAVFLGAILLRGRPALARAR